jgi:NAD(P)-dependent dehydrogenase (short-subunit alcohol dehydrogenase family)
VAKNQIRVNAICPGVVRTGLLGELDEEKDPEAVADLVADMHMGRMGLPEEIAEAVLFLTSGRASLITATTLAVNGGNDASQRHPPTAYADYLLGMIGG